MDLGTVLADCYQRLKNKIQMIKTDMLVIGSGIAGLTFAIKMARQGMDYAMKISSRLLSKKDQNELEKL